MFVDKSPYQRCNGSLTFSIIFPQDLRLSLEEIIKVEREFKKFRVAKEKYRNLVKISNRCIKVKEVPMYPKNRPLTVTQGENRFPLKRRLRLRSDSDVRKPICGESKRKIRRTSGSQNLNNNECENKKTATATLSLLNKQMKLSQKLLVKRKQLKRQRISIVGAINGCNSGGSSMKHSARFGKTEASTQNPVQFIMQSKKRPRLRSNTFGTDDSLVVPMTSVGLSTIIHIQDSVDVIKRVAENCNTKEEKSVSRVPLTPLKLYVCQFCLDHFESEVDLKRYHPSCQFTGMKYRGECVYKKDDIAIYEVDGEKNHEDQLYCWNLSKMARLYVKNANTGKEHAKKFFNYVLFVSGVFAGYFSKEKSMFAEHNLAVLLVLPEYRKLGLGRLLISFSYEISKMENQMGTPERALSKSGARSYASYWMEQVVQYVAKHRIQNTTMDRLSKATFIKVDDLGLAFMMLCKVHDSGRSFFLEIPRKVYNRYLNYNQAPRRASPRTKRMSSGTANMNISSSSGIGTKKYNLNKHGIIYVPMKDRTKAPRVSRKKTCCCCC